MLIPRTWFKVKRISIWVASLSLISFLHLSVLWSGRLTSYIKIYHLFVTRIYHINFSPVSELEFRLWRWNMTFLDTEMKELGRSTHIHKTRSLIRAPHVCLIHIADRRSLHVGRILTHIHTHTHTTQIRSCHIWTLSYIEILLFWWEPCVKSVQIRIFYWPVFSCSQSEYRKIRTRKNSVFGHFSRREDFMNWASDKKLFAKDMILQGIRNGCSSRCKNNCSRFIWCSCWRKILLEKNKNQERNILCPSAIYGWIANQWF